MTSLARYSLASLASAGCLTSSIDLSQRPDARRDDVRAQDATIEDVRSGTDNVSGTDGAGAEDDVRGDAPESMDAMASRGGRVSGGWAGGRSVASRLGIGTRAWCLSGAGADRCAVEGRPAGDVWLRRTPAGADLVAALGHAPNPAVDGPRANLDGCATHGRRSRDGLDHGCGAHATTHRIAVAGSRTPAVWAVGTVVHFGS